MEYYQQTKNAKFAIVGQKPIVPPQDVHYV